MISYEKYSDAISKELGLKMIIYDWKAGKGTPKTESLLKIAGRLGVPIENFIVEDSK